MLTMRAGSACIGVAPGFVKGLRFALMTAGQGNSRRLRSTAEFLTFFH